MKAQLHVANCSEVYLTSQLTISYNHVLWTASKLVSMDSLMQTEDNFETTSRESFELWPTQNSGNRCVIITIENDSI